MKNIILIVLLLGLLTACLVNPPPRLAPAVQETTFTQNVFARCGAVVWQEQLLDAEGKDITDTYTYEYFEGGAKVQEHDSLARLLVTIPGQFTLSPQVNFTSAVKIINTYACEKTGQVLVVTKVLLDGSSKQIEVDYAASLVAK